MYCTNCGKQIIDTARFCNYCGTPVAANFTSPDTPSAPVTAPVENTAVSAPISEAVQENNRSSEEKETAAKEMTAAPTDLPSYNEDIPSPEHRMSADNSGENEDHEKTQPENLQPAAHAELPSVSNIKAVEAYSLPAPSRIPVSGESAVPVTENPGKPAKPLPERKYTLGHIMMCLAAVAVMAIVAGVFAGLYFSVV